MSNEDSFYAECIEGGNKDWIEKGKIDRKFAKILKNLKDDREDGDYEVFTIIDRDIAENAIQEAEEFLKEAKRYLEKYIKK